MILDRHRFRAFYKGQWWDAGLSDNDYFYVVTTEEIEIVEQVFQCTGLQDMEGTPIWEGTIIRLVCHECSPITNKDFTEPMLVEWSPRGWLPFCDACPDIGTTYFWTDLPQGIIVIGNTTENPELLEDA